MDKPTRICVRCVSDTTIPGIRFDAQGVCNFCNRHDLLEKRYPLGDEGKEDLDKLIKKMKVQGKSKKHDCVIGLSGGTDSTYSLYLAVELGLRPLVVHLDNTWNTDVAEQNMKKAISMLGVDLVRLKVDWDEFRNLQLAFLKASVPEAEIPTDVAIHAALFEAASREGIKYVINGHSFRSEGIVPIGWTYMDGRYIRSVNQQYGMGKLRSFPNLTLTRLLYLTVVQGIKGIPLLNYVDYNKREARVVLERELGWSYYGGHHFESEYTRFVIAYLLWKKFGIDKRKVAFSAQIRSGQRQREEALKELEQEPEVQENVVKHCLQRLGLTEVDMEQIMKLETKSFRDYGTYYNIIRAVKWPVWLAMKMGLVSPILYGKYYA